MNQDIKASPETKVALTEYMINIRDLFETRPKTFLKTVKVTRLGFIKYKKKVLDTAALERFTDHPALSSMGRRFWDDKDKQVYYNDYAMFLIKLHSALKTNDTVTLVSGKEIYFYRDFIEAHK